MYAGSFFAVPFALTTALQARKWLWDNDVEIIVTVPPFLPSVERDISSGSSRASLWKTDLSGPVGVVMGSEKAGEFDYSQSFP